MKRPARFLLTLVLLALVGCAGLPETKIARRVDAAQAAVLNPDDIP